MEERGAGAPGVRRDEDIALDMMKFIAVTTGYGRAGAAAADFSPAETPRPRIMRGICWICTDSA